MSFHIGIVGLPNVGKSTLFTALTKKQVLAANYPFATIDPNVGVVPVPDARLEALAGISGSAKILPTTIEFVDIAGLVAGASQGEGLGNKFLANIRECDAILHVVRGFDDADVLHVSGSVDVKRDIEVINTELVLADLDTVTKRLDAIEKKAATLKDKALQAEVVILKRVKEVLDDNRFASTVFIDLSPEERRAFPLQLLTLKPMIYGLNLDEAQIQRSAEVVNHLMDGIAPAVPVCAKVEADLASLSGEEAQEYLDSLGLKQSGLDAVITKSYDLLNLITYFTTGPQETRAWTITRGTKAPQAAGVIHTDFEQGFIKAEVYQWKDLVDAGSESKLKELGKLRIEGKEYVMQDGDVCHFRFAP
jgi:GTP-binding protein YchF